MAASGGGQSPIDISNWRSADEPAPTCAYASAAKRAQWVGGLPMIQFAQGSELRLCDVTYRLLQVHWHTPAEHTINGETFDLEVHLVHQNAEDELLVLGTVYRVGPADDAIEQLINATPTTGVTSLRGELCASQFVASGDGCYHYVGSLTAPPFSEPVQWYIDHSVRTASQQQVERLQAFTNGPNARPLQDRNSRSILCVG